MTPRFCPIPNQTRDQPGMRYRPFFFRREEPGPFLLEPFAVDQRGELHRLVAHINQVDQARPQQIVLARRAPSVLHDTIRNWRLLNGTL